MWPRYKMLLVNQLNGTSHLAMIDTPPIHIAHARASFCDYQSCPLASIYASLMYTQEQSLDTNTS